MGLRFRKSFKVAPGVKVNLNKKSTSVTFGGNGVHKTYSSSGKKTTSVGIPGTGAYYTTSSGGGSGSKKPSSHKRISADNLDPVLTEDLSFQNNVADGSSASLDKFTTDSLKRYKITSAILSAFLFFVALIGFAGLPAGELTRRCGPLWHPAFARSRRLAYRSTRRLREPTNSGRHGGPR